MENTPTQLFFFKSQWICSVNLFWIVDLKPIKTVSPLFHVYLYKLTIQMRLLTYNIPNCSYRINQNIYFLWENLLRKHLSCFLWVCRCLFRLLRLPNNLLHSTSMLSFHFYVRKRFRTDSNVLNQKKITAKKKCGKS